MRLTEEEGTKRNNSKRSESCAHFNIETQHCIGVTCNLGGSQVASVCGVNLWNGLDKEIKQGVNQFSFLADEERALTYPRL